MASIASKHWYRFNFLKSHEWLDQRLMILAEQGGKCNICGIEDWSNDVHRIYYKNIHIVEDRQCVVLCRAHHELVHKTIPPTRITTDEERTVALKAFSKLRKQIKRVAKRALNPPPPPKPVALTNYCFFCLKEDVPMKRVFPLRGHLEPSETRGICFCDGCMAIAERLMANNDHKKMWDKLKEYRGNLNRARSPVPEVRVANATNNLLSEILPEVSELRELLNKCQEFNPRPSFRVVCWLCRSFNTVPAVDTIPAHFIGNSQIRFCSHCLPFFEFVASKSFGANQFWKQLRLARWLLTNSCPWSMLPPVLFRNMYALRSVEGLCCERTVQSERSDLKIGFSLEMLMG